MEKILNGHERICLFCGQPEKQKWEEYESYYECDCKDAKETRKINEQIEELNRRKPQPKYEIVKKYVLYNAT